jgi:hypothetical protein
MRKVFALLVIMAAALSMLAHPDMNLVGRLLQLTPDGAVFLKSR